MHSDERYMKVIQQQQLWPDNPLFIVDQTLKQPLFRLPAEHLFSALIDSIRLTDTLCYDALYEPWLC